MIFDHKNKWAQASRNWLAVGKYLLPLLLVLVLLSGFRSATFTLEHLQAGAPPIANTILITWFSGSILGPLLLPWLPGRSLATKGLMAGLLGLLLFPASCFFLHIEPLDVLTALLVIPSATTTIMMRNIIPIHAALMSLAAGIWIAARFI